MSKNILDDTADQVREDIEFLIEFAPASNPEQVKPGLAPMFYVTGTYEGDVDLAKKVQKICERYDIVIDNDEEDFEEIE